MLEAGRAEESQRATDLKKAPLDGFMGEADRNGVSLEMRTRGGVFWSIPADTFDLNVGAIIRVTKLEKLAKK